MVLQLAQVARAVQPAVAGLIHQVQGAAAARGHHRDARGHGLLDRLAEGLELSGVHEDVERGHGPGQVLAALEAGEVRVRQPPAQSLLLRARADDHQPGVRQGVQAGQVLDLLLRCEPTDVADQLPVAADLLAPGLVSLGGIEAHGVHAPAPHVHALHPVLVQLADRERGRRERHGREVVQRLHVAPQHVLEERGAVAGGVAGDLGLVDGCAGHAELVGGLDAAPAEHERGGQVDHVRGEALEDPAHGRGRPRGQADIGVAGQRHGRQAVDDEPVQGRMSGGVAVESLDRVRHLQRIGGGADDHRMMALGPKMLDHADDGVGDSVHMGQELFGDDSDSHAVQCGAARGTQRRRAVAWR